MKRFDTYFGSIDIYPRFGDNGDFCEAYVSETEDFICEIHKPLDDITKEDVEDIAHRNAEMFM